MTNNKLCPKCGQEKDINAEFYKRGKKENNRPASYCKQCFNSMCIVKWKQRKIDGIKLLGNKCVDCQQSYHPNVYDFHHLNGKDYDWNQLRLRSTKTIIIELNKCILLCSNCHCIRHIIN